MRYVLVLVGALMLVACSKDPAVHLEATDHQKYPRPLNLEEVMEGSIKKSVLACYRDLGTTEVGSVEVKVSGSHGLMDVELKTPSGNEALDQCALGTMKGGRIMREVGDTNDHIGFVLRVRYVQE